MQGNLKTRVFRNVYILDSKFWWAQCETSFDLTLDLVLTYDFGLKNDIEVAGGTALFLDHLVDAERMQENNFRVHKFFREWNLDKNGNDLFVYRGVPFGFSFRVDILNELTFSVRTRLCIEELGKLNFETVYLGTSDPIIGSILDQLNIHHRHLLHDGEDNGGFYFPIFKYMHENTRSFSLKSKLKDWYMHFQGSFMPWLDRLVPKGSAMATVFIQEYHPTRRILECLREKRKVRVVVERISATSGLSRYVTERPIPMWGSSRSYRQLSIVMLQKYQAKRHSKLTLSSGSDVSEFAYEIIDSKLKGALANQIFILNNIINYVDLNPVTLEVLIANIGRVPTLLDCVLKRRGIPSFLIINGLLGPEYSDESKYATVINGYSQSIKDNYFKGMDNVVCLGDPRMDSYYPLRPRKSVTDRELVVTIGASGFNPVDLNSYVAVEFDFLGDVLQSLSVVRKQGVSLKIVVKVRPNGYLDQYKSFLAQYYPDLVDSVIDVTPMKEVLEGTDFYISIYSQTLFEASCMGIPVLCYRKDTEIMDAPFDGKSELVSVDNVDDLVVAIRDASVGHTRFDAFLSKTVMEKYIGFLDGKNLERNIRFIEGFLGE